MQNTAVMTPLEENPKELQAHVERLRLILDATTEGWWEWHIPSRAAYRSPNWFRMLGFDPEQFSAVTNSWHVLLHPDDQTHIPKKQTRLAQNNDQWELTFRMRTASGAYKWILSKTKVVERDSLGRPVRLAGTHQDISERKQLEQIQASHRYQEELLQGITRVSHASFEIYDIHKKSLQFSSGKICRWLDYTEEEIRQFSKNHFIDLLHPDDKEKATEHLQQLLQANDSKVFEHSFRMRCKSGKYHWILLRNAIHKRNGKGRPLQLISSAIDIGYYKKIEKQIQKNIVLLEKLSHQNSHQLRAPVATIIGLTNLIKDELVAANHSGILLELVDFLEKTVKKMDMVIHEFQQALDDSRKNTQMREHI